MPNAIYTFISPLFVIFFIKRTKTTCSNHFSDMGLYPRRIYPFIIKCEAYKSIGADFQSEENTIDRTTNSRKYIYTIYKYNHKMCGVQDIAWILD